VIVKQEVKVEADGDGNSAEIIVVNEDGRKVCTIVENVQGLVIITIYHPYHWGGITGRAVI